jgi:DNA modification methylase
MESVVKLRPPPNSPAPWRAREIEQVALSALRPPPTQPRVHSRAQIQKIAAAIQEFGFTVPILIDHHNTILAGQARVEAARSIGWDTAPAIRVEHLSDAQTRAFIIADNRLPELATWDKHALAREFQFLAEMNFDVEITAFETPEIDLTIRDAAEEEGEAADVVSGNPAGQAPISRLGDAWWCGRHRILCADAREARSYETLLGEDQAQMVFADAPYNVPIHGNVSGTGRHGEFIMASGEMTSQAFEREFLTPVFNHLVRYSHDGSIHFHCMDWRHAAEILAAGRAAYTELKNLCVWAKTNAGMGSLYRSGHEFVFVFKSGRAPHVNNVELGKHGRNRTNVWTYAGVNTFRVDRREELEMHPTVKPVALVADAILDCSRRNALILDPFAGSGTTLIAAEKTGRRAAALELDARYVDTIIRRWQAFTGRDAIHAQTGLPFAAYETRACAAPLALPAPAQT